MHLPQKEPAAQAPAARGALSRDMLEAGLCRRLAAGTPGKVRGTCAGKVLAEAAQQDRRSLGQRARDASTSA